MKRQEECTTKGLEEPYCATSILCSYKKIVDLIVALYQNVKNDEMDRDMGVMQILENNGLINQ